MGLPLSFKSKKSVPSLCITILLSDSNLQAALWRSSGAEIEILNRSSIRSYSDQDQVVVEADKALQDLGKESEEVSDVVFGLPHTWVDEQGVAPAKKPLLKTLTDDLSLKAVGFVVTSEAIAKHLIAKQPRLSMLLIELSQHELYLSLIDQGQLISTKYVGRSAETISDMAEALARLNAHQEQAIKLPSKMMLVSLDLNEEDLKDQQQLLLNHDWVNSHGFMQPPTVETFDKEMILEAVVKQETSIDNPQDVVPSMPETVSKPEISSEPELKPAPAKELAIEVDPAKTQASTYGIPVKLGVLNKKTPLQSLPENKVDLPHSSSTKSKKKPSKIMLMIRHWFKEHRTFAIGGFVAGLLALAIITGVWLRTGVKAEVRLSLDTEMISKESTITLNSDSGSTDVEQLILAASTIDEQTTGKKTAESTGVKVVGDKATGKVTLYNKTDGEKVFETGTELIGGDFVFTLNEEVRVASASTTESGGGSQTNYGKEDAEVTAVDIGSDYNLSKDTELQVGSFDSGTYSAIVAEAFSGGSSREVRVISAGDQEQLLTDLREKLLEEAQTKIESDLAEGEYIAAAKINQVDEQSFDAEVGDEIGAVTLDLTVTVQAMVYKTEDLKPLAQKVLEADIPEGYTLANSEPQILSAPDQEASNSGVVTLIVNISSEAKPDLNFDELKQTMAGKKIELVTEQLMAQSEIKGVEIKLIPSLATRLYHRLPKDPAKIEIQ